VKKTDRCGCLLQWPEKKIKLHEQAIGEILVDDSGSEASDIDD
jgi:hypothetical protein